jgi:hypothetical protein
MVTKTTELVIVKFGTIRTAVRFSFTRVQLTLFTDHYSVKDVMVRNWNKNCPMIM